MAKDILTILITTVASESAFNDGARVLDNYRSALLPDVVNGLVCTSNWINSQHKSALNVNVCIVYFLVSLLNLIILFLG
ncbi:Putative AC9 transposase [Apostasia shenzhenica]|uniref:AC9 transposase n=1 Tax=Apostasia shenzhenica TaxID=1088818 RepID=A0A2I0AHY1_9ASPA|nr:Putative AC9 transposase [Apostasia shenzhenica]